MQKLLLSFKHIICDDTVNKLVVKNRDTKEKKILLLYRVRKITTTALAKMNLRLHSSGSVRLHLLTPMKVQTNLPITSTAIHLQFTS